MECLNQTIVGFIVKIDVVNYCASGIVLGTMDRYIRELRSSAFIIPSFHAEPQVL